MKKVMAWIFFFTLILATTAHACPLRVSRVTLKEGGPYVASLTSFIEMTYTEVGYYPELVYIQNEKRIEVALEHTIISLPYEMRDDMVYVPEMELNYKEKELIFEDNAITTPIEYSMSVEELVQSFLNENF